MLGSLDIVSDVLSVRICGTWKRFRELSSSLTATLGLPLRLGTGIRYFFRPVFCNAAESGK